MKELLERWAELEPDRCIVYDSDFAVQALADGEWIYRHELGRIPEHIIIQNAVQEAIEARGGGGRFLIAEVNHGLM